MPNYLLLHTALLAEARPLIEKLGLVRLANWRAFQVYQKENIYLCISGIGKIKAASVVAAALSYITSTDQATSITVLNIGIVGATKRHPIGTLGHVVKAIDRATNKSYYSDFIIPAPSQAFILETVDLPLTDSTLLQDSRHVVDMELTAVFVAAKFFCSTSDIFSLKVVSDHLDASCTAQQAAQLIASHLVAITKFIEDLLAYKKSQQAILSLSEIEKITEVASNLRLTVTQQHNLIALAKYHKLKKGHLPIEIEKYTKASPSQSHQRSAIFSQLRSHFV